MIILGFNSGFHDASVALFDDYRLVGAVSLERLTRQKGDGGGRVPDAAIDEVLSIAGLSRADVDIVCAARTALPAAYYTHLPPHRKLEAMARQWLGKIKPKSMSNELRRYGLTDADKIFDGARFLKDFGFTKAQTLHFYNHHKAHAISSLFFTDWQKALLYTADGSGDNVHYSHYLLENEQLINLYGDDRYLLPEPRVESLGMMYGYFTQALGYKIGRHEGKLTGLSAHGEPKLYSELASHFRVDADGCIQSDFADRRAMQQYCYDIAKTVSPADAAASVQKLLEEFIVQSVNVIHTKYKVNHLALGGGVFANVKLNRLLAEQPDMQEVFIFPAMGDEGLPAGGCLDYLLLRDGLPQWLKSRYRLDNVYLGRDYNSEIETGLLQAGAKKISDDPVAEAARRIIKGECGAIYNGRMEFGPRALEIGRAHV